MRAAAAALLALALGVAACASDEERKAQHLERADQYLAQGDVEAGLIELRSALQLAPQDAAVCLRIAEALVDAGAQNDAVFFYGEARRLDPQNDAAALGEARLLFFTDAKRARELIDSVLARSPESALAHARRSEIALIESDTATALAEALLAIELAPEDVFARMQLGIARRAEIREKKLRGETVDDALFRAAIEAFERAAELAQKDSLRYLPNAWVERALVYSTWVGHEEEAIRAHREAAEAVLAAPLPDERKANVLNTAARFARVKKDAGLERWTLERLAEVVPSRLATWSRLAELEKAEGRSGAATVASLLARRPDDAAAHALYSHWLQEEGKDEEAADYLARKADELQEPWAVLHALARLRFQKKDLAGARSVIERLEKERPVDAETQILSAQLALEEERVEDARTTLRKLIGQDDRNVAAQRLLAEVERRAGDPRQSAAALRRAMELGEPSQPQSAALLRELARTESQARNWAAARDAYLRLGRREGSLGPQDKLGLARALYALDDRVAAKRVLDKLLLDPDAPVGASLVFANREGKQEPARARQLLERAAARAPENEAVLRELVRLDARQGNAEQGLARLEGKASPSLLLLRARILAGLKRLPEATAEAERALEAAPDDARTLALVTQLYQQQGRTDEAVRRLEENARAGRAPLPHRVLLGRMLTERGERARALEIFEQVLKERSDLPGVKNDVAYLISIQEAGDLRRALQLAREAREARPEISEFADTLGYVYLRLQMTEAAVDQLKSAGTLAREGTPGWATAQFHLGLALKQAGRKEEAAEALNKALASAVEFPEAEQARQELRALSEAAAPSSPS